MPTTISITDLPTLAGVDLGYSDWLEVGQDRIDLFAHATGDDQWIHLDAERARTGPFGTTIAHGFLSLALIAPLWEQVLTVTGSSMSVNYGIDRLRFISPVPAGSAVRLHSTVESVTEIAGGWQLTVEQLLGVQDATRPAVAATCLFRFYPAA
ncbi:MaoC family dehydratase [Agromyces sp. SYSU T00266]|uniref:MaoC family dehydratase n=1 Tax=Agromyces zhanjiangensis TaxID=3158562 RepID=UPI003393F8EA